MTKNKNVDELYIPAEIARTSSIETNFVLSNEVKRVASAEEAEKV